MPKERGKYKQYLWDNNKKIPSRTHTYQRRLLNLPKQKENETINNLETPLDDNIVFNTFNNFLNNAPEEIPTFPNEINNNNDDIDDDELLINDKYDETHEIEENIFSDYIESHDQEEITQEDLAVSYLAAFFNGRTTQDSFKDYLTLTNFTSQVKLPTTFDGLNNLVVGKKNALSYEKSWFCNTCIKPIKQLDNRLQRLCLDCKSR